MSLAPLASPAGRKGISTSFDSIYLDGSMFHELMQPQLQFKDLTTNVVHKSSYGLTVDGALKTKLIGAIYNSNKLEVKEWNIQSVNPSIFETPCTMGDVSELVGRSLTIHEGADASSVFFAILISW